MGIRELMSDTKPAVHLLVCLFAISSWVDLNGLWVELPILVTYLPEKWTLPSFIIIISQIGNIGPIIFAVFVCLCKGLKLEKPASAVIICVGIVACVLLSFFWKNTTYLFGELRATALFVLSFMLSVVDCTSSMAFLAFMAHLKPQYLSSFFVGEGLSGLLPSLIALAQGAGSIKCVNGSSVTANFTNGTWYNETRYSENPTYETPRFSVQVFFLLMATLMSISLIAFLLLNFTSYCKQEQVVTSSYDLQASRVKADKYTPDIGFELNTGNKENYGSTSKAGVDDNKLSTPLLVLFLVFTSLITMQIYSFLLSVQSYTSLPYGLETYHLAATITNIANTLAGFMSLLLPLVSTAVIVILTFLGTGFSAYLISLAAMSPEPPLVGTQAGGAVSVTCWALAGFFLVYAKVSIAGRLRQHGGRRYMLWYGAFTQIGSAIGAIIAYIIVNVYSLLKDAPFC